MITSNVDKTGVAEANLMVSGRIFEIHKSVQTKAALAGAIDFISEIFYLCGVWPTFVPWLTVFLGQTLVISGWVNINIDSVQVGLKKTTKNLPGNLQSSQPSAGLVEEGSVDGG